MKGIVVLEVALGVVGVVVLSGPAPAQTLKAPAVMAAQRQAEPKPAADDLVKLLQSKGILSDSEAAIASQAALQPQTKQVLAEMLLSKHLITSQEYDQTIAACSSPAAQAAPAASPGTGKAREQQTARSKYRTHGDGEPGAVPTSFSDWIASILPGGGATSDIDFGTIQPSPLWPPGEEPQAKHKSHKHHRQDASQRTPGPQEGAPKQ